MSLTSLLSFALVYLVFVVSPGPGVAATVARGLGAGLNKALGYIVGFILGDIIWFAIAATGLAALATTFETTFLLFKYAGCAYLIYMAWKIWVLPVAAEDVAAAPSDVPGHWAGFFGTLTLTLSNPKVIVFFLSIMPLVVDVPDMTLQAFASMALIMAAVCGTCILTLLFLAAQARKIFQSRSALRSINRTSAVMMAGAALVIGLKA
jgi:threonine/homoserine/homoserine lactone efflux protein